MSNEWVREYFSFTRKERIGVFVLIFLILVIFLLPLFLTSSENTTDQRLLNEFKNEIARLKIEQRSDSDFTHNQHYKTEHENNFHAYRSDQKSIEAQHDLFYFDPNNLSRTQWEKLGVKDKTINTLQHYIARGGRFKKPEDLKKVYGITEQDYKRLSAFIDIQKTNPDSSGHLAKKDTGSFRIWASNKKNKAEPVNINTADSTAFTGLPGIGSRLASRIIHFREKLGGFYAVEQVGETFGLPDSSFQKIRPLLSISNDTVRQIDINSADIAILQQHPYIRWDIAKIIIQYRQSHGMFKSVDDLQKIAVLNTERLKKIMPYLKIGP